MLTSALIAACCARYGHLCLSKKNMARAKTLAICLVGFVLVAALGFLLNREGNSTFGGKLRTEAVSSTINRDEGTTILETAIPPKRTPYAKMNIEQVELYVAIPASVEKGINGILLAFHGCTHSGLDWFRLPEEGVIVRHAISQRVAVVAFSSYDRFSGCWSDADLDSVPKAFRQFQTTRKWAQNVPLFAIGASSGGSFAAALPMALPGITGIMVQIARPNWDQVGSWVKPYPKSIQLLFMTKDYLKPAFEAFIASDEVKRTGVRPQILEAKPCGVTKDRLMERVYDMNSEIADSVISQLVKRQILDSNTLFPLERNLYGLDPPVDSDDMFLSIQEEVKACFAHHELTAEFFPDTLDVWLKEASP